MKLNIKKIMHLIAHAVTTTQDTYTSIHSWLQHARQPIATHTTYNTAMQQSQQHTTTDNYLTQATHTTIFTMRSNMQCNNTTPTQATHTTLHTTGIQHAKCNN